MYNKVFYTVKKVSSLSASFAPGLLADEGRSSLNHSGEIAALHKMQGFNSISN